MKLKIKFCKELMVVYFLIIMLFSVALTSVIDGIGGILLKNSDEIFAFIMIVVVVLNLKKVELNLFGIGFFWAFIAWGIICTILFGEQSFLVAAKDCFVCSKFIITFWGVYIIFIKYLDVNKIKQPLLKITKILTCITSSYCVYSLISSNTMDGIRLLQSHGVNLSHIAVGFISIFLCCKERKKIWILMCCVIAGSSMTAKSFGIIVLVISVLYFKQWFYGRKKFILYINIIAGMYCVGLESIEIFFLNTSSARSLLFWGAYNIAKEKIIFGVGYAMYGSSQAALVYSPIYVLNGFANRYGMTQTNIIFLTDSFWPIIIGQFGFIGLILFGLFIFKFLRHIFWIKKIDYNLFITSLVLTSYLLIMSFASTAFFNPIAVPYAVILGMAFAESELVYRRNIV